MKQIIFSLCLALSGAFVALTAQERPVVKVDLNMAGRQDAEVLEPGYTSWSIGNGSVAADSITVDGVTFKLSSQGFRGSWNKALIQAKTDNSRLTMDGIMSSPERATGEFTLSVRGLPAGEHSLQTFHNDWSDPEKYLGMPIHVFVNEVEKEIIVRSWRKTSVGDVSSAMFFFTVEGPEDEVFFRFYTNDEDDWDTEPTTQTDISGSPVMNGFELNTTSNSDKAKKPYPADLDMHALADDGNCLLSWSPANASVRKHYVYFGTDAASVGTADTTTAGIFKASKAAADTTLAVSELYSLDTYYWRVDEEGADGVVTPGDVWCFRPRQLAFPGAEGYGRYALGGRGGIVYHVTNLKHDHNPGSFLYGLVDLEGPRTIVFDVSGIIEMDFGSFFAKPYVTIAAQTAPGKGICLKASNMGLSNESICRFLRARRGYGQTGNAMGCGSDQTIIDHTTAAWGTDETFSSRGAKNMTLQYSMIAEALGIADHQNYGEGSNHGFAATIGGNIGTFSHNLLANCNGRNWSMGGGLDGAGYYAGRLDIFNNVVYNWKGRTTDGGAHEINFVGNYYKQGPANGTSRIFTLQLEGTGQGSQSAYLKNNVLDSRDGSAPSVDASSMYGVSISSSQTVDWEYFVDEPFFPSYATIHSPQDAYKIVLSDAGVTMPCRDEQHLRIINEALSRSYTYTGSRSGIKGQIDHENDAGGFEAFPEESRPAGWDSDQDGMPDWWEKMTGSDPDLADNNEDPDRDGYTLLEDYLEFMAHPYVVLTFGQDTTVDVTPWFRGFQKSPVFTIAYDSPLFEAEVSGAQVKVRAGSVSGMAPVTVTVTDSDGSTFSQRLSVAVARQLPTAIDQPVADLTHMEIVSREFFTLDGKKAGRLQPRETYIMKVTDTAGRMHSVKVIMD
ncbi:MAG: T9SS C-terminal target domain-containing protein [Bacteroidales bacterium]|nr:T9SS C-terminal target domain-containing protein [Bacteroidales bacterium]